MSLPEMGDALIAVLEAPQNGCECRQGGKAKSAVV